jgi:hypothetical protein
VPYWETVFYYPPLVGYIAGAFARLAPDAAMYIVLWSALIAVAAVLVAAMLAHAAGARAALIRWSIAPQLLLYAGANFDVVAIAFVVAAALLARGGRAGASLIALAAGTCVKVFPAAVAPLEAIRGADPSAAARRALTYVAVVVAIALPSVLAPWPVTAFADDYAALVNFDSPWALVAAALGAVSLETLVGPITAVGLLATYALGVVPVARRSDPVVGAGLALATVLIWTRLYSPQYSLWMLPFFALTSVPERWPRMLVAADVGVFLTVYPLTLVRWPAGDPVQAVLLALLAAAVAARHVALAGTWLALYRIGRSAR